MITKIASTSQGLMVICHSFGGLMFFHLFVCSSSCFLFRISISFQVWNSLYYFAEMTQFNNYGGFSKNPNTAVQILLQLLIHISHINLIQTFKYFLSVQHFILLLFNTQSPFKLFQISIFVGSLVVMEVNQKPTNIQLLLSHSYSHVQTLFKL